MHKALFTPSTASSAGSFYPSNERLPITKAHTLTNYNYPGVCFTKYAPGPEDQPNRSNLTA